MKKKVSNSTAVKKPIQKSAPQSKISKQEIAFDHQFQMRQEMKEAQENQMELQKDYVSQGMSNLEIKKKSSAPIKGSTIGTKRLSKNATVSSKLAVSQKSLQQKPFKNNLKLQTPQSGNTSEQPTLTYKNENHGLIAKKQEPEDDDEEDEATVRDEMWDMKSGNTHDLMRQNSTHVCSSQFGELLENIKAKLVKIIPFNKIQNDGKVIGEGGFGSVYSGKWSNTNVAIKEMLLSYSEFKTMDQEMSIMAANRHPKLVTMFGIAIQELRQNKLQCCIVMELMQKDLETVIFSDTNNQLPLKQKVQILKDVTEGVSFLHQEEIVHRDLKPKNILLNANLDAKLTDLGIAKALEDKEKTLNATIAFTARYVSRESAVEEVTSFSSDIWSLGLVMYELLAVKRCWNNLSSNKIIISLAKMANPFEEGWEQKVNNKDLVDLIKSCVDYDPDARPKAPQILTKLEGIYNKL